MFQYRNICIVIIIKYGINITALDIICYDCYEFMKVILFKYQ